jgi:hypothetical protein
MSLTRQTQNDYPSKLALPLLRNSPPAELKYALLGCIAISLLFSKEEQKG